MKSNAIQPRQVGVWVDHEKALIVTLVGEGHSIKIVQGDVGPKHKSTGGVRSGRPYWHRSIESAKRQSIRRTNQLQHFYHHVEDEILEADQLILLGPGGAKEEFATFLSQNRRFDCEKLTASVSVPSHMTEPQIVAHIKKVFGHPAPRKTILAAGMPQPSWQ